ncbi:MAG: S1C family serine protease [Candidatus Babeliales bacterium]
MPKPFILSVFSLTLAHSLAATQEFDWSAIRNDSENAIVHIAATIHEIDILQPQKEPKEYMRYGVGFIVSEDGAILTNFHLVNQARNIQITLKACGGQLFEAYQSFVTPDNDLAVLQLRNVDVQSIIQSCKKLPTLPLGNSEAVQRGNTLLIIGSKSRQEHTISANQVTVSGKEPDGWIQVEDNFTHLGGPAVNSLGEVVGFCSYFMSGHPLAYLIPSWELKKTWLHASMLQTATKI